MEDTIFISQLKNGEPSAFNELFNRFGDKVFNTSLGILQNKEDAEDITQEVFLKIFKSIVNFKEKSKLSTWISPVYPFSGNGRKLSSATTGKQR